MVPRAAGSREGTLPHTKLYLEPARGHCQGQASSLSRHESEVILQTFRRK